MVENGKGNLNLKLWFSLEIDSCRGQVGEISFVPWPCGIVKRVF